MNLEIFSIATQGVASVGALLVREDQDSLNKHATELVGLTDEELRARCLQAIRGEDTQQLKNDDGLLATVSSYVPWFNRRTSSLTIKRIALAVEAFKRAPADLPARSALYPQQIQAALSLTRRCLIQMDTGEGKTYALLPAAFALACEYHRVYIVCANDYLAWRDANRTSPFWEFAGLQHGLCLGKPTDDWSSRVIYTTLQALIFEHMGNVGEVSQPNSPITFGAILIDEADAILLDQGDQSFSLIQPVSAKAFDWSFALAYAKTLVEDKDVDVDYSTLKASLTVTGETRLRETLGLNIQETIFLSTRFAVELAYIASEVALEDRDYIIEDNRIFPIDPITGKVLRNVTPHWVIPLEVQRGFEPRAENISLDLMTTTTFLRRFQHLSGLSGTIADDALEYLFLYFLPTLVIKPRKKRHHGTEPDLVYRTGEEADETLCAEVLDAVEARRPVLVGTQTIADAENIYRMLSKMLPPDVRLNLLTGRNDYDAAQIFALGGEIGSVIVATQLAGRGVDIRLSDAARNNGGLALFSLGHSLTIRHDKQFLGRAGRQGDPFSARFICSYQDELLRRLVGERTDKVMDWLGQGHGVAVESPFITRQIAGTQNNFRRRAFWSNQQQALLNASSSEIRKSLESWFEYLQLPAEDGADANHCSQEFLEWAVEYYVKNVLEDLFPARGTITSIQAEQIAHSLNNSLGLSNYPPPFTPLDVEGRDVESAAAIVRKLILKKLNDAIAEYRKTRNLAYDNVWSSSEEISEDETQETSARAVSYDSYLRLKRITERTPRSIAFWSIRSGWMGFLQERSRIMHRVYQKRLSTLEHYRVITDKVTDQWQKTQRDIAAAVLRNLLRSGDPSTLDDLFVYADNRVDDFNGHEKENPFTWEAKSVGERDNSDPNEKIRLLIGQFVAQATHHLDDTFTVSHLRRLLADFAEANPLYLLQSPARIQKALETWNVTESERGVGTARRKLHKKWLHDFLVFLRERKLIGVLPGFHTRLRSAVARFVKTVTETRTALTCLGVVAFLIFFILAAYGGDFGQPKLLGPFGTALDRILFAGLLSEGNIAAPAFGILVIAYIVSAFIFPDTADGPKDSNPFQRALVLLMQLAFAWWLTDWHYGQMTAMSMLRSFGVFFSTFAVALITKRVVWLLESSLGLSLIAGWVSFSVLFVFLPAVAGAESSRWLTIGLFAGISVAYYLWKRFNNHEVELVTTLLKGTSTSMEVEEISGNLRVEGDAGVTPHIYAVLSAWLLYELLTRQAIANQLSSNLLFVLVAVYVAVLIGRIVHILNRRFSIHMWQADLNERRQMIKDVHNVAELQGKLKKVKQLLLRRELAFQVLIVTGVIYLLYRAVLPNTLFPLSLVVVFSAFLFAVSSKRFALDLYKVFYNRTSPGIEVLDFSDAPEQRSKRSGWQQFKRVAKVSFAVLLATYGVFEVLSNAYEVLKRFNLFQ